MTYCEQRDVCDLPDPSTCSFHGPGGSADFWTKARQAEADRIAGGGTMTDDTRYLGETVSGDEQADSAERTAREIGTDHGTAAGSWVVDGNTSADSLRALIQASDDGEFWDVSMIDPPAPLSGEWADGYSVGQLLFDCDVPLSDEPDIESEVDPIATAYEDAYWQAFEDEVVRSARAMLPDEPDHDASPNPDAMTGAVFTTCTKCSIPVWREDDGTVWQHVDDDEEGETR